MSLAKILDHQSVRHAVLSWTVDQYHRLGEADILREQTELLNGIIVRKTVKSPTHTWLVSRFAEQLRACVPAGCHVRQEQPLTLADSEPEPDLAIVRGTPDDYRLGHPETAELVIEIAASNPELDRSKLELYARAAVSEVWIVLAKEQAVEVYQSLSGAEYERMTRFVRRSQIEIPSATNSAVALDWLFATADADPPRTAD